MMKAFDKQGGPPLARLDFFSCFQVVGFD